MIMQHFDLKYSSELGRYLVAKSDFKKGQLVFEDAPLLVYPHQEHVEILKQNVFICFGCYRAVKKIKAVVCSKCRWPACCSRCAKDEIHANAECEVFREFNIIPTKTSMVHLNLLRSFLCKRSNPCKWAHIDNLLIAHDVCETQQSEMALDNFAKEGYVFLKHRCKITDCTLELVKKLIRMFAVNSFGFSQEDANGNRSGYAAIYSTVCMLAHSCSPNMDWNLPEACQENQGSWTIQLFSRHDIKAGDKVTISYTEEYLTKGILERRASTYHEFKFLCQCERCKDPTELGTHFSAIVCPECEHGAMLPEDSSDFNSHWICEKCGYGEIAEVVKRIEDRFHTNLLGILQEVTSKEECEVRLDRLISKATTFYQLHPNHNLVIRAIQHWLSFHSFDSLLASGSRVDNEYKKIMRRVKRCLGIYKILGRIYDYAMLEACISTVIIRYRFKSTDFTSIGMDNYSAHDKEQILKRIVKHLHRGVEQLDLKPNRFESTQLLDVMKERHRIWSERLNELQLSVLPRDNP